LIPQRSTGRTFFKDRGHQDSLAAQSHVDQPAPPLLSSVSLAPSGGAMNRAGYRGQSLPRVPRRQTLTAPGWSILITVLFQFYFTGTRERPSCGGSLRMKPSSGGGRNEQQSNPDTTGPEFCLVVAAAESCACPAHHQYPTCNG
jgi:hypothetical protein